MKKNNGFSLIELMIVVAILGILLAIALPSYRDSIEKSERGLAQAALMSLNGAMEQYYSEHNTYVGATLTTVGHPANVPLDGGAVVYKLSIPAGRLTTTSYRIKAMPTSPQVIIYRLESDGTKMSGPSGSLVSGWTN